MHYYKKNLGDYAKKTGRLSMLQHGAYNMLIDCCYDRETFPTLEEAIDWLWASTKEEIEAVEFVLKRFFTLQEDGRYVQKRIAEELAEYKDFKKQQAQKGKKGGRPRKAKPPEEKPSGNPPGFSEKPEESQRVSEKSLNQEPLTTNQEPIPPKAPLGGQGSPDGVTDQPAKPTKFVAAHVELPPEINHEAWREWCAFRSQRRKPVSEAAARKQIKLLRKYPANVQQQIIDQSIQNDYQGLFEPKGGGNGQNTEGNYQQRDTSAAGRAREKYLEWERTQQP